MLDFFLVFFFGDLFGDISDLFVDKGFFSDDFFGDSFIKLGNGVFLILNEVCSFFWNFL